MHSSLLRTIALSAALIAPHFATSAAIVVHVNDRASFLSSTNAMSIGTFPTNSGNDAVVGNLHFRNVGADFLAYNEYSTELPGSDLAVSGAENFDIFVIGAPTYSLGFSIHEPTYFGPIGCAAVCFDTTFEFNVYNGATLLASYLYNPPDDDDPALGGPIGFIGFHTDVAITLVTVRDLTGVRGVDNEIFNQFVTGSQVLPQDVPEPASWAMFGVAIAALAATRRRTAAR